MRGECEAALFCMPRLLGQSSFLSNEAAYAPPVDTRPPTLNLTLLPRDVVISSVHPGPHVLETTWEVGHVAYSDPGWGAVDDFDGDVSAAVSALGLGALQAAVASGVPTDPAAPFVVQYNVVDAGGNSATAVRLVHLVCGGDEERCSKPDGGNACTVNGVCDVRPTSEAATELSAVQLVGPDVVFLARGTPYRKCTPDLPLDLVCDQVRVAKWRCRVASPIVHTHPSQPPHVCRVRWRHTPWTAT